MKSEYVIIVTQIELKLECELQTYSVRKLTRSARGASPSKLKAKIQGYTWHKSNKYNLTTRKIDTDK
jgi:hypothetical protein